MKHLITALILCWLFLVPAAIATPTPQLPTPDAKVLPPQLLEEIRKLTASDAAAEDNFGWAVSVSGDTAVVGAYKDDDAGSLSGSAYVFERNQGGIDNWGEVTKLTASDAAAEDEFGFSVSISGDTLVVGAHRENDPAGYSGSAYVFERNQGGADNWGEVKKLTASDAAAGDELGWSVSISGATLVVGAPFDDDGGASSGSAYVFERNQGGTDNWGEVKKLTASDAAITDIFGVSVSISGATLVIGAWANDDGGQNSGSAYVFERHQGGADNWGEVKKLTASDAAAFAWFGWSVSISGGTVVVGAPNDDAVGDRSGSAYIFERNQGGADNWGEVTKLTASDGLAKDHFGRSVTISGDAVMIGAPYDDDAGSASGSAYVFERHQGGADNWGEVKKLTASDAASADLFGYSVTNSGDTLVVGAYQDDDAGTDSGSAYVFDEPTGPLLSLVKSVVNDENLDNLAQPGETISYTYDVTNTGNVTLSDATVTDPHSGLSAITCVPAQGSTLAAGATMQCTATYTVTQADVDAGQVDNTGNVAGDAPGGDPADPSDDVTASDTLSVPMPQNPAVMIAKSSNATGTNAAGDVVTYTYDVTNTGNVTLADVTVTDPHGGLSAITCVPAQGSTLAPGATVQCTATYTVTQADVDAGQIDNTGSVSAEAPGGDPADPGDDVTAADALSEPVSPPSPPSIDVAKQAGVPIDVGGGELETTITLTVTNTGSLELSNVQVSDDLSTTFPLPTTFSIQAVPVATGTLVANPGYDGDADTGLLTPASSLPMSAAETITFTVRFVPDDLPVCHGNIATASAQSPTGATVTDTSATVAVDVPILAAFAIAPGQDFLATGSGSYADFAVDPLPAGFFDPGSDPFTERVNLTGVPLDPALYGDADTVITRQAPANLPQCPSSATVPIEVVDLSLVNVEAFTVTFGGGSPELWDVAVGVSTVSASAGTMTIRNECAGGGTWDSTFDLVPRYVFTRRGDAATRILDPGPTKVFQASDGHWVRSLGSAVRVPGTDFFPGFEVVPCACDAACPIKQPTDPVVHVASGGAHTIWLPRLTIGVAMQASPPVDLGGGELETTLTVTVTNLGNLDLADVQVSVDLAAAFPAPALFSVQGVPVATGTLTANPGYDGDTVLDLLAAVSTLAVDATETVTFTVRFVPDDLPAWFKSTAVASGRSSDGSLVSDFSDDGTDPDPNGNRNPADPGENDPTLIDVGHASSYLIDAGVDFLTTGSGSYADFAVDPLPAGFFDPGSDAFTGRVEFTGDPLVQSAGDPIAPTDTIVVRQAPADLPQCPSSATVPIELTALGLVSSEPITVTFGAASPELWDVVASVSGQAPSNGTMTVRFECSGGGGSFDSTLNVLPRYVFTRRSDGATRVLDPGPTKIFQTTGAHWVESLSDGVGVLQAGPGVTVDGDNDGSPDFPLTLGSSNFFPGFQVSPCTCDAKAISKVPTDSIPHVASGGVHRVSLPKPKIGLAKQASLPLDLGSGQFQISFTLRVTNPGNTDLWNVQVSDDLAATFPAPASFTVGVPAATGTLTVNPAYNGASDSNLLVAGTSQLPPGAVETITFTVTFEPAVQPAWFENTAVATAATGETGGATVSDTSDDGTEPDPDGDGNPDEPGENDPTPIHVAQEVDLAVTKSESADPVPAGSGDGNLTYVVSVANNGPDNASGVVLSEVLTLRTGTTIDSVTPNAGTFAGTTWTLGNLASGAGATLTVVLTVSELTMPGYDVICDTATLIAVDQIETDSTNDTVSECTSVHDLCGGDPDCLYIPAGTDCWHTDCGRTKFSFCDGTALPAGFFAAGSETFTGEVLLRGGGFLDTGVRRQASMVLPDPDSGASVPIELTDLELESCAPITVIIDAQPVDWDVDVSLSEVPAGQGSLNVSRTHANGGVFDAQFPLHARFTFTRVDDPAEVREFDTGDLDLAPIEFSTLGTAPWVATLTGPDPPLACGTGFAPGVEEDPVTLEQCCRKVGHAGPGHLHETAPPDCTSCPRGACCNPVEGSCAVVQTVDECPAPGAYKGDGTDCRDSDGDGLSDVLESNSCCGAIDSCNRGTDPGNPDTDDDGILDGMEVATGTDPCVADTSIFEDGFESGDNSAWSSTVP